MKRHGLWRFHYEAREVRRVYPDTAARWWIDEEVKRTYRMIECMHSGWGRVSMWSNADAIVVCARRYARLYKQPLINVGQWNELCRRIAKRAGLTHHANGGSHGLGDRPGGVAGHRRDREGNEHATTVSPWVPPTCRGGTPSRGAGYRGNGRRSTDERPDERNHRGRGHRQLRTAQQDQGARGRHRRHRPPGRADPWVATLRRVVGRPDRAPS